MVLIASPDSSKTNCDAFQFQPHKCRKQLAPRMHSNVVRTTIGVLWRISVKVLPLRAMPMQHSISRQHWIVPLFCSGKIVDIAFRFKMKSNVKRNSFTFTVEIMALRFPLQALSNTKVMESLDGVQPRMELRRYVSTAPTFLPCTMLQSWLVNSRWRTISRALWKRWPTVSAIIQRRTIVRLIGRPKRSKFGKMLKIQFKNYKIIWRNAAGGMMRTKKRLWNNCVNKFSHKFRFRRRNWSQIGMKCSTMFTMSCQSIYSNYDFPFSSRNISPMENHYFTSIAESKRLKWKDMWPNMPNIILCSNMIRRLVNLFCYIFLECPQNVGIAFFLIENIVR